MELQRSGNHTNGGRNLGVATLEVKNGHEREEKWDPK
jgi:hypothetical protein